MMPALAIQYLEDGPHLAQLSPEGAAEKLRSAFARLPIDRVLIGWNLRPDVLEACAVECARAGAALYRWHPLLTGDALQPPPPDWQTIALSGSPIAGFQRMPEFTFVCPNHPAAAEAVLRRLEGALENGPYQGVFLDRIRYPSPASDPVASFGCFCANCQRAAAEEGLNLNAAAEEVVAALRSATGVRRAIHTFFRPATDPSVDSTLAALLDFRERTITRFVAQAVEVARKHGMAVGLDTFSPTLCRMVGQNLRTLDPLADWVKIMSYGHTFGPAGLPFELLGLADWLVERHNFREEDALALLAEATGLPLPRHRDTLRRAGLSSTALQREAERAREAGVRVLLAGIELVEIAGVAELDEAQIRADLAAFEAAGVDGLALSWDLWVMPLERLELVRI
jgi:hypothetical protein